MTPAPASIDRRETATDERLDALIAHATNPALIGRVIDTLTAIEPDKWLAGTLDELRAAAESPRGYWDICLALAAFADLHRPARYLEIGVRRGRSAAVVAAMHPDVDLYLFDMWYPDYAGVPNPGPAFVRGQLERVGHRGDVYFGTGRSQDTVPAFLASADAPATFDLVTVDGDHRDQGALADLENVLPHLSAGGLLVFDDITHPEFPGLGNVWRDACARAGDLRLRENLRDATGTGLAMRLPYQADPG